MTDPSLPVKAPSMAGRWFDTLLLMVLENHGFSSVQDLQCVKEIASVGLTFSNWHGATHPSGPNYRAMMSGQTWSGNEWDGVRRPNIGDYVDYKVVAFAGEPAQRHNPFWDMRPDDPSYKPFVGVDPTASITYLGMDDNNNAHSGSVDVADGNVMSALRQFEALSDAVKARTVLWITTDEGYGLEYPANHVWAGAVGAGIKAGAVCAYDLSHYNFARFLYDNWGLAMAPEADPRCAMYAGKNLLELAP